MDSALLTKYNECARICGLVMNALKRTVLNSGENTLDVETLSKFGNDLIESELSKVYKKEKRKGIGYPVCISLNNCVGHYVYEKGNERYNKIKSGDVVKIELGVNIGEAIAVLGETVIVPGDANSKHDEYIQFLNSIAPKIANMMCTKNNNPDTNEVLTNDDVRIFIESSCTNNGCFPVENCVSYQMFPGQLLNEDSKYIILNHQQYYDDDDMPLTPQNTCMDLNKGDIFTINLTIVPEVDGEIKYVQPHEPHVFRFNGNFYNLRLKSSREFCAKAKGKHFNNAFWGGEYSESPKMRIGIKESEECGILDRFEVYYTKDYTPVYHKKFNVIVGEKEGLMLKYN